MLCTQWADDQVSSQRLADPFLEGGRPCFVLELINTCWLSAVIGHAAAAAATCAVFIRASKYD